MFVIGKSLETENSLVVAKSGRDGAIEGWLLNSVVFLSEMMKKCSKIDSVDGCTALTYTKAIELCF